MPIRRALLLVLATGLCASTAACGPGSRTAGAPTTTAFLSPASNTTTMTTAPVTAAPAPTPTTSVDPGDLPQTPGEPATGSELDGRMQVLWQAIVSDQVGGALPLFFPEPAYETMKTGLLPDPISDYNHRLLAFYRKDIGAYHAFLGPSAAAATLVGVSVASTDATWILPRHCENLIGYWHLPGVRLVYQEAGITRSFAVASLISWRDEWYVVHLGPNPRPAAVGTVDQPALGAGSPGPPGGC